MLREANYSWAIAVLLAGIGIALVIVGVWVEIAIIEGRAAAATRGRFSPFVLGFGAIAVAVGIPAAFRTRRSRSEQILAEARRQHYGVPWAPRVVLLVALIVVLCGDAALAWALLG